MRVNPPATGTYIAPEGQSRLVPVPTAGTFTGRQETDARLAIARGLAEYLEQLFIEVDGGRVLRFKSVHPEWAEPEEHALSPAAAVVPLGMGAYEARSFTPSVTLNQRLPAPDGRYLVVMADYTQDMSVEVWCSDPEERTAMMMMLERAFNPTVNRYGFVLELPHYFNARATYALKESMLRDSEDNALRRYRIAVFTLTTTVPVISAFGLPSAKPSFELRSLGSDPSAVITTD